MRNIGNAFVAMCDYQDAIQTYETIIESMQAMADIQVVYNLGICYYAVGDIDKAKMAFLRLVEMAHALEPELDNDLSALDDHYYNNDTTIKISSLSSKAHGNNANNANVIINTSSDGVHVLDDELKQEFRNKLRSAHKMISVLGRLLGPAMVQSAGSGGYEWIVEQLTTYGLGSLDYRGKM